jgi:hypothetical protein
MFHWSFEIDAVHQFSSLFLWRCLLSFFELLLEISQFILCFCNMKFIVLLDVRMSFECEAVFCIVKNVFQVIDFKQIKIRLV